MTSPSSPRGGGSSGGISESACSALSLAAVHYCAAAERRRRHNVLLGGRGDEDGDEEKHYHHHDHDHQHSKQMSKNHVKDAPFSSSPSTTTMMMNLIPHGPSDAAVPYDERVEQAVGLRLERMGLLVGMRLLERMVYRSPFTVLEETAAATSLLGLATRDGSSSLASSSSSPATDGIIHFIAQRLWREVFGRELSAAFKLSDSPSRSTSGSAAAAAVSSSTPTSSSSGLLEGEYDPSPVSHAYLLRDVHFAWTQGHIARGGGAPALSKAAGTSEVEEGRSSVYHHGVTPPATTATPFSSSSAAAAARAGGLPRQFDQFSPSSRSRSGVTWLGLSSCCGNHGDGGGGGLSSSPPSRRSRRFPLAQYPAHEFHWPPNPCFRTLPTHRVTASSTGAFRHFSVPSHAVRRTRAPKRQRDHREGRGMRTATTTTSDHPHDHHVPEPQRLQDEDVSPSQSLPLPSPSSQSHAAHTARVNMENEDIDDKDDDDDDDDDTYEAAALRDDSWHGQVNADDEEVGEWRGETMTRAGLSTPQGSSGATLSSDYLVSREETEPVLAYVVGLVRGAVHVMAPASVSSSMLVLCDLMNDGVLEMMVQFSSVS